MAASSPARPLLVSPEPPADDSRRRWPSQDVLDELLVGHGKGADADEADLVVRLRPPPRDDDDDTDEEPRG
ncbi:MAG: hypothetical protein H6742_09760 [Alphaproteobacteria bacterium]|nr:hypothetical protein [Alphaproteobacteria bacterium]